MSVLPATAQELDPVSRVTARAFVVAVGSVSVFIAIGLGFSGSGLRQLSIPWLGVLAVVVLAASYALLFRWTDPFGPVLSRLSYQVFFLGIIVAAILNALSQFGHNELVRDDWGTICLGLALLVAAPYRPSREIIWFMAEAVTITASLAVIQQLSSITTIGVVILVVVAIAPSLAIGAGAAAYSYSLVGGLRARRLMEQEMRRGHDEQLRRRLLESDAMGELGALRSEVVPYLERLIARGSLVEGDAERAAELASGLRLAIVERLSRSSLSGFVGHYSDESFMAPHLSDKQRAALRALIVAIAGLPGFAPERVALVFAREAEGATATVTVAGREAAADPAELTPFLRMMRFVFRKVAVYAEGESSVFRFSFDMD